MSFCTWLLLTHQYQLHTATCSSYLEGVACFKYVFLQAKMNFCTWLLLTHHYQLHTATCSSFHKRVACSKYVFLQAKMSFCTWLLFTHHYQLYTATCSSYHDQFACSKCVLLQAKMGFARGCYPLIIINLIYMIVLYVLRKTCRCKKYDPQVTYQNSTHHRSNNIMLP